MLVNARLSPQVDRGGSAADQGDGTVSSLPFVVHLSGAFEGALLVGAGLMAVPVIDWFWPVGILVFAFMAFPLFRTAVTGGTYLIVDSDCVSMKTPWGGTFQRFPIKGLDDLKVVDGRLFRRRDGLKIARLTVRAVNSGDAASLEKMVRRVNSVQIDKPEWGSFIEPARRTDRSS